MRAVVAHVGCAYAEVGAHFALQGEVPLIGFAVTNIALYGRNVWVG